MKRPATSYSDGPSRPRRGTVAVGRGGSKGWRLAVGGAFLAGALLSGCGDSAPIDEARWHVEGGRLERAEELLAGYEGTGVDRLRAAIARRLAAREAALAELEALRASRDDRPSGEVLDDLRAAVAKAKDPVVKERAEIELSRAYDWVTERGPRANRSQRDGSAGSSTDRPARRRYATAEVDSSEGDAGERDSSGLDPGRGSQQLEPIVGAALAAYEEHVARRDWRAALVLSHSWSTDPEVSAEARGRFEDLYDQALAGAVEEADDLVVEAFRLQQDGRERAAQQLLAAALERFPQEGRAGSVARTLWRFEGRDGPEVDRRPGVSGETTVADGTAARESEDESADDAARAEDAGNDSSAPTDERQLDPVGGSEEVAAPEGHAPNSGASSVGGSSPDVVPTGRDGGGSRPDPAGPASGSATEDVARREGDPGVRDPVREPDVVVTEVDESRSRLVAVGERLVSGQLPELRDAAFVELLAEADHSPVAREVLEEALRDRWESALKRVERGGVLRRLARVAAQRERLDEVREHALTLIFDEERYFYPYRTPHVTPSKAATYPEVQREVARRVEAVDDVWDAATSVKLSKANREGLAELHWLRQQEDFVEGGFERPENVPSWIEGLPHDAEAVDLSNFAWTHTEAVKLARDRAVRSRNEALWERFDKLRDPGDDAPARAERDQVRVTNAYRAMMGRPALAWNAELQVAADSHSDYMADTGDFGHFEGNAATRTPFDRMRKAGYACGVSENCHMGSGDPEGAHGGWVRSSGHHRNLLRPDHKEMASAVAGGYWTQNFGHDTAFQAELDLSEWLD